MLFDLRSPRRRLAIKLVYGFLAVLIGGGLVLFGVGGGAGSTGLLSQLAQQGTGSSNAVKVDETALRKAERKAKQSPDDATAWAAYVRDGYTLAATNDTSSGWTAAGAKELAIVWRNWEHYLALKPPKPDARLAADLADAFGAPYGLHEWKRAEQAQEIVAEANPNSASQYAALAIYGYLAKDYSGGSIAQSKAYSLASKTQRKTILSDIAQEVTAFGGATGPTGATG